MGDESGGSALQLETLKVIVVGQQRADRAADAAVASISSLAPAAMSMRSTLNGLRAALYQRRVSAHPTSPDGPALLQQGHEHERRADEGSSVAGPLGDVSCGGDGGCQCGNAGGDHNGDHKAQHRSADTTVAGALLS